MAKPVVAMEKNAIKAQLRHAVNDPIGFAVGLGPDPTAALLLVDKIKSGKKLLTELQKDFQGLKNPAFGTVQINPEDDKTLDVRLNKVPSGTARRLVKALRGTGIKFVSLVGEDGSSEKGVDEEAEEGAPAAAAGTDGSAAPAPAAEVAPEPDLASLTQRLRDLVEQVRGAIAAAPQRQRELMGLATEAQAGLKAGDLQAAAAKLDALEKALGAAPPSSAPTDAGAAAGAVQYAKVRLAWLATRKRMVADTEQLAKALEEEYGGIPEGTQIMTAFRSRVAPVLERLDEALADKLDEAVNAADAQQRSALVAEARQMISSYQDFVAGEPLIADLDDNPFVPLNIAKTLTATLGTLSASVR